jgi:hypothetical protein
VSDHGLLHGLAEVVPQMPSIRDLRRIGRAGANTLKW